eukprot:CAMPEP_0177238134 /NCGR_PEP_ID=MMETSP0367-20130122/46369_1 /TAXON_ID=447022 ORGANISM="Scrippsiella hangoei-like, Strain SHHI-4" /NCGR_SAMPLE_ID=MMETSP0367 /ASSEMBLY_ACC=CAM_ASM_000362 /LENGTH=93 /DNA_ID=CAMNT_0018689177 /DNA_START=83 /DNA_END=365 /DNA_ORIENTATION=+
MSFMYRVVISRLTTDSLMGMNDILSNFANCWSAYRTVSAGLVMVTGTSEDLPRIADAAALDSVLAGMRMEDGGLEHGSNRERTSVLDEAWTAS